MRHSKINNKIVKSDQVKKLTKHAINTKYENCKPLYLYPAKEVNSFVSEVEGCNFLLSAKFFSSFVINKKLYM